MVIFRADLLPDGAIVFAKRVYEEPEARPAGLVFVLRVSRPLFPLFLNVARLPSPRARRDNRTCSRT